jgi:hypothetical protein
MDPNIAPTRKEKEYQRVADDGGDREVKRTTVETPGYAQSEETVSQGTGTDRVVSTKSSMAPSAAAASQYNTKKGLFYSYTIIWYVLAFIEIVLAFRFVLKMLGANPESGFSNFVYGLSYPFAAPFLGIFSVSTAEGAETVSVFEWSTIIAALVYAIIAWGLVKILAVGKPRSSEEIVRTVDEQ